MVSNTGVLVMLCQSIFIHPLLASSLLSWMVFALVNKPIMPQDAGLEKLIEGLGHRWLQHLSSQDKRQK